MSFCKRSLKVSSGLYLQSQELVLACGLTIIFLHSHKKIVDFLLVETSKHKSGSWKYCRVLGPFYNRFLPMNTELGFYLDTKIKCNALIQSFAVQPLKIFYKGIIRCRIKNSQMLYMSISWNCWLCCWRIDLYQQSSSTHWMAYFRIPESLTNAISK